MTPRNHFGAGVLACTDRSSSPVGIDLHSVLLSDMLRKYKMFTRILITDLCIY